MADAGFKLTVEGEREFRKAISDINAILRLNQAELQKVTAEYNAGEKSIDSMKAKQTELGGVIERQTAVVAQMEDELSRLTDTYGENDKGTIKMRTELDKASASLASMQAQFRANAEEIEKAAKAAENYDTTIADADAQIKAFAAELRAMETEVEDGAKSLSLFGKNSEETKKQIKSLTDQNDLLEKSVEQHRKKLDLLNEEMEEAVKLYGSQSREVASYRTEIATTQAEVNGLTQKIDANNDKIREAEDSATDLSDVFGEISDSTGIQIPEGLTKMVGGLDSVAAAGGAAAVAVAGILKAVKDATAEAEAFAVEIGKMANEYNLTTTQVQELQHVSSMLNVEYENVVDTMKDLTEKMYDASTGNEDLASEFNDLGVSIYDTEGGLRDTFDVLIDLVDAYGNIENKTERAARMQKILGESSRTLNTLIYEGGEAIKQYREQAHEWGIVMEDEVIDRLEVTEKKTRELNAAWEAMVRNWAADTKLNFKSLISGDFEGFWKGTSASDAAEEAAQTWLKLLFQKITGNYATGTYNHPGGYALVGERGPEIVDLPAGSRVYPNGEYPAGGTVNYYNVSINASDVKEFNDIVRIAQSKRVTERMK